MEARAKQEREEHRVLWGSEYVSMHSLPGNLSLCLLPLGCLPLATATTPNLPRLIGILEGIIV